MFLNQLKENEKELFLQLALKASMINDDFAQEEQQAIPQYCYEMMLPNHLPDDEPIGDILDKLDARSSKQEKNIIVFELLMLLKSDGVYDVDEHMFMKRVIESFNMGIEKYSAIEKLVDEYMTINDNIVQLIDE